MYGLPANTNLDFLKGKTLIQACFGENDLILNFSENIAIAVFSSVGFIGDAENVKRHTAFADVSAEILSFLSKIVTDVCWTREGTVTLSFSNGREIQIYDDSESFESFTITSPQGQLIV